MAAHEALVGGHMVWRKTFRLALLAIAGLALLSLAAACEEEDEGPTTTPAATSAATSTPLASECVPQEPPEGQANLFHNPGLESGREPWCSLHPEQVPPFEVSQDFAQSGESSALLRMRVPAEEVGKAKVFYLVQEVTPEEFPELISGYYRVESWSKGTPKQYLQFVVIAFDVVNLEAGYPNYQMRYPLAGISEEPFNIANAFFVFLTKEEPRTGEWIYFERNIKEDFEQFWGVAPEGFSKLRVLFEVRYDDKQAGTTPAEADVYYDSLYMGPASENPNNP
ncbi:MAG: hypothetical protein JSU97_07925 [Dehalococcoidia bacterium]|nr:MAG: hypothetical protein JSU97_07925 [Dehalococcoidia bacterium]